MPHNIAEWRRACSGGRSKYALCTTQTHPTPLSSLCAAFPRPGSLLKVTMGVLATPSGRMAAAVLSLAPQPGREGRRRGSAGRIWAGSGALAAAGGGTWGCESWPAAFTRVQRTMGRGSSPPQRLRDAPQRQRMAAGVQRRALKIRTVHDTDPLHASLRELCAAFPRPGWSPRVIVGAWATPAGRAAAAVLSLPPQPGGEEGKGGAGPSLAGSGGCRRVWGVDAVRSQPEVPGCGCWGHRPAISARQDR